jgi:hypothetical protein
MEITSWKVNTRLTLHWAINTKAQQQTVGRITICTYLIGRQINTIKAIGGQTLYEHAAAGKQEKRPIGCQTTYTQSTGQLILCMQPIGLLIYK